jgi:hypothetical protein
VIVVSATESDPAYLLAAGEFLYDPTRLTVALSRAKRKLVLVAARSVFGLFSPDDEVWENALLWKNLLRRTCTELLWEGPYAGTPSRSGVGRCASMAAWTADRGRRSWRPGSTQTGCRSARRFGASGGDAGPSTYRGRFGGNQGSDTMGRQRRRSATSPGRGSRGSRGWRSGRTPSGSASRRYGKARVYVDASDGLYCCGLRHVQYALELYAANAFPEAGFPQPAPYEAYDPQEPANAPATTPTA